MTRSGARAARLATGLALAALLATAAPAIAEDKAPISVTIDRAKVMRISRPADVIIIGNPAIADATIQDNQTLIITGRSFGTTNLIVLDSAGKPIADEILNVAPADDDVVTLYQRGSRVTVSCTPNCAPTIAIGDKTDSFKLLADQLSTYNNMTGAAAEK